MSAGFTPAPWRLRIDPYEDDPFPGKDFFTVRFGDDCIQGITEPANARLIAAAPELYEELAEQADGCATIIQLLSGQTSAVAASLIGMLRIQEQSARAALAKAVQQ